MGLWLTVGMGSESLTVLHGLGGLALKSPFEDVKNRLTFDLGAFFIWLFRDTD